MSRKAFSAARAIGLTLVIAFCSYSQTVKTRADVAPRSESWTQQERVEPTTPIGTVVCNVVTPTLTVYLPERAKATGTGIIVAPGGAFRSVGDFDGPTWPLVTGKRNRRVRAQVRDHGKTPGRNSRDGYGPGRQV